MTLMTQYNRTKAIHLPLCSKTIDLRLQCQNKKKHIILGYSLQRYTYIQKLSIHDGEVDILYRLNTVCSLWG